jgi:hypothetical protein
VLILRFRCVGQVLSALGDVYDVPAKYIPLCVVHLEVPRLTVEQATELLATRDRRALQSLKVVWMKDAKASTLIAELVTTDRKKQWTLSAGFSDVSGRAFAKRASASARTSSLTCLSVQTTREEHALFALLLLHMPTLTRFELTDEYQVSGLEDKELDLLCESWCEVPGKALLSSTSLHSLQLAILSELHLRAAVQRNHSLIVCTARGSEGFGGMLLFNRVSHV